MMSPALMGALVLSSLERARKDKGLTQQAVADAIGMDRANFARMEGGSSLPGSGRLFAWAAAVGMTVCVMSDTKQTE